MTLVGGLLLQLQRRQRDDDDPLARHDGERPLPLEVVGAAELEDLQGPPADFLVEHVAQDDDVVRDELLDAVARHGAVVLGAFGGDQRRDVQRFRALVIRNSSCADGRLVGELGEDAAERVEDDPAGADPGGWRARCGPAGPPGRSRR